MPNSIKSMQQQHPKPRATAFRIMITNRTASTAMIAKANQRKSKSSHGAQVGHRTTNEERRRRPTQPARRWATSRFTSLRSARPTPLRISLRFAGQHTGQPWMHPGGAARLPQWRATQRPAGERSRRRPARALLRGPGRRRGQYHGACARNLSACLLSVG